MKSEKQMVEAVAAKERLVDGIPAWMLNRGYSRERIEELMALRERAFPATKLTGGANESDR